MTHKEIEAFLELFNTSGWKLFIEGLEEDFLQGNNLLGINDTEQFWQHKGRMHLLSEILGFEDMLKQNIEAGNLS